MSKPYFTPARCSCPIPVSPYDAVICGALADEIVEEGPRCDACLAEFGGTPLDEPEVITFEQMAVDERFTTAYLLDISTPCHKRNGGAQ